jgi:hypothetical protein
LLTSVNDSDLTYTTKGVVKDVVIGDVIKDKKVSDGERLLRLEAIQLREDIASNFREIKEKRNMPFVIRSDGILNFKSCKGLGAKSLFSEPEYGLITSIEASLHNVKASDYKYSVVGVSFTITARPVFKLEQPKGEKAEPNKTTASIAERFRKKLAGQTWFKPEECLGENAGVFLKRTETLPFEWLLENFKKIGKVNKASSNSEAKATKPLNDNYVESMFILLGCSEWEAKPRKLYAFRPGCTTEIFNVSKQDLSKNYFDQFYGSKTGGE